MLETTSFSARSRLWRATFLACTLAVVSYVFTDLLDLDGSNLPHLLHSVQHAIVAAEEVPTFDFCRPDETCRHILIEPPYIISASSSNLAGASLLVLRANDALRVHNRRTGTLSDHASDWSAEH